MRQPLSNNLKPAASATFLFYPFAIASSESSLLVPRGLDAAARSNLPCSRFDGPGVRVRARSKQQVGVTRVVAPAAGR